MDDENPRDNTSAAAYNNEESRSGGPPPVQNQATFQSQPTAKTQRRGGGGGGIINMPKLPKLNDIIGNKDIVKQLLGEFLGTFFLVFFGIGSVLTADSGLPLSYCAKGKGCDLQWSSKGLACGGKRYRSDDPCQKIVDKDGATAFYRFNGQVSTLHISFGFGIAVASIAQAIGHISGCHLNPAVSIGLLAAGECSIIKFALFSLMQILGAVFGCGVLKVLTWKIITKNLSSAFDAARKAGSKTWKDFDPESDTVGWPLGCSELGATNLISGIFIEMFLTMILIFVVCGVCDGNRKDVKGSGPLAIGFAVFLCHVVGIRLTGSSVNPARSIGPAFLVHADACPFVLVDLVVYIIGPLLGGFLAGLLYNIFFRAPDGGQQVAPA